MAISNGSMRGSRVVRFQQGRTGGFVIVAAPFDEEFDGEFLGLVTGRFVYQYLLPEGVEVETIHAVCDDELLVYERRVVGGPVRVSACIADLGGGGPVWGLSLAVKERDPNSPVTLPDFPPCSPLPWVFFKPSGGGPFTIGRGQGAWEGNVFISRA